MGNCHSKPAGLGRASGHVSVNESVSSMAALASRAFSTGKGWNGGGGIPTEVGLPSLAGAGDTELLHLVNQRGSLQSQARGCAFWASNHPFRFLKSRQDAITLDFFKGTGLRAGFSDRLLQLGEWWTKHITWGQNHGSLNEVLEFTDIPGPVIAGQPLHGLGGNRFNLLIHESGILLNEVPNQKRDILRPLAKGRCGDGENVQPIVKVTTEFLVSNHLSEVATCGCNHTRVYSSCMRAAQSLEFLLLQHP